MNGMPWGAGSVPVTGAEDVREWIAALDTDPSVMTRLADRAHANPGRVIGSVPPSGTLEPADARAAVSILTAAFGDVQLASGRGPTGSWRLDAASSRTATLLVAPLRGSIRVRRDDHIVGVAPLAACLVTDDRDVAMEGIDDEVQVLVASVPAARLRAIHRELMIRGPVLSLSSPELRATVAYLGTLLAASLADEAPPSPGAADIVTALVATLAEAAFSDAGSRSRSTEVRQAALRCIDRRHRSSSFGVDDIARELYISRRQLYRAFPDAGGIAGMIAQRRLETAERLMRDQPSLPLGEVASLAGFSTAGVMRAHFRRAFGTTPQRHRAGPEEAG